MFPANNWFLNKYDLRGHLRTSMSSTDEIISSGIRPPSHTHTHRESERERERESYIHTHVGACKKVRILLVFTFQQYIILKALN